MMHVPMLGSWWAFALVIAAVLFTSLGIGFVISIVSQTDSQAVQVSMIVLLSSVFFSGFIMSLDMFYPAVRIISWMLPTTYGTLLLRDIMLRGTEPNWMLLGGLAAIGLVLMLIAWRLMRPPDYLRTMIAQRLALRKTAQPRPHTHMARSTFRRGSLGQVIRMRNASSTCRR